MASLSVDEKIDSLAQLGTYLKKFDDRLRAHMHRAEHANPWFTIDNQENAISAIAHEFLDADRLKNWMSEYHLSDANQQTVGVIAAGNIPLVGFHDVLSVFMSGNVAQIKISDRDPHLIPFVLKKLGEIHQGTIDYFDVRDTLSGFDAVIATGSNNSARYFNQYFGKYPHIIRKNRNGVAILTGEESTDELKAFGKDVFQYFGLGCRNVSHIFIPEHYNFEALNEAFLPYSHTLNHSKYRNNFDHNLAIFLLNRVPYLNIESVLLVEDENIISPIGCLYYSKYKDLAQLSSDLNAKKEGLQCVVSGIEIPSLTTSKFGEAQTPSLTDYADGMDTMQFLTSL